MVNVYEGVASNKRRSALIIILFSIFVALVAYFIGQALNYYYGYNPSGLGMVGLALIISGITSYFSYYYSDKIILGLSSARPADKRQDFMFYTVAENLSLATGLPMPKLYVVEDTALNAFATGRDPEHAVICATTGLLSKLNRTELEGVIGHEMSHVGNYDIRLMSVVTVMVGIVTLMADWLLRSRFYGSSRDNDDDKGNAGAIFMVVGIILALLSPLIAQLVQLALSRRREFLADASSVKITRQPSGLISALKKLEADKEPLEVANKATAHLFIVNPFHLDDPDAKKSAISTFANLFNTHPPIADRLKALESMS